MEDLKNTKTEKGKKYRYRLRQAQLYPFAVTQVPVDLSQKMGLPNQTLVTVGLSGKDAEQEVEGTPGGPPRKISVPGATQAQLKYILDRGDDSVEEYED